MIARFIALTRVLVTPHASALGGGDHHGGISWSEDVRSGADRRRRPTPMLSRHLLFGRRRRGRRMGETDRVYVDRPGRWATATFIAVMTLSMADAYFTLNVLAAGGEEANPVMGAALSLGNVAFVILKMALTFLGAAFLCLHKTWPLGRACLWAALLGYTALAAYVTGQMWLVVPGQ